MAEFDVTAPDGRTFTVSAPDGASQDEVLAYAKSNFSKMPGAAAQADVRKADNAPPKPAAPNFLQSGASAAIRGLTMTGGSPLGAVLGLAGEGMRQGSDLLKRGAYAAGGAVTDALAGKVTPEVAAGVGTALPVAAEAAEIAFGGGVGSGIKFTEKARTLMQSALKPGNEAVRSGKFDRAVTTMLDEGLPATKGGAEQMQKMIGELEDQAQAIVKQSKGTLQMDDVMNRLISVYDKYLKRPDAKETAAAISKVAQEGRAHPLVGKDVTVQGAQELKEGIYQKLGDKSYGQGLTSPGASAAERDALKAQARGFKEEIERVHPEIAPINKQESDLINALKITARRVGMEGNKNPGGLGWLLAPGHSPEATLAFMAWLGERSPALKSALAHGLYSGTAGRNLGAIAGGVPGLVGQPQTLSDLANLYGETRR